MVVSRRNFWENGDVEGSWTCTDAYGRSAGWSEKCEACSDEAEEVSLVVDYRVSKGPKVQKKVTDAQRQQRAETLRREQGHPLTRDLRASGAPARKRGK